jgi:uncharacterized membrane protein
MTFLSHAWAPLFASDPNPGFWAGPVDGLVVSISLIIRAVGVAIIVWGAYCGVLRMIALETAAVRQRSPSTDVAAARLQFSTYLLAGLDFLIAGGVIRTLGVWEWPQAAALGGVVLVRATLGLVVKWEGSSLSTPTAPECSDASRNGPCVAGPRTAPLPAKQHPVVESSPPGVVQPGEDLAAAGAFGPGRGVTA